MSNREIAALTVGLLFGGALVSGAVGVSEWPTPTGWGWLIVAGFEGIFGMMGFIVQWLSRPHREQRESPE